MVDIGTLALAGLLAVTPASDPGRKRVEGLLATADRLTARPLWPGFEPQKLPLALFDGQRTWLVRHPLPPAGFTPVAGCADLSVAAGRHPDLTANTAVELNGVLTATVFLPQEDRGAESQAGLLVHELFHVFQRLRHPAWEANEAELFVYPVNDAAALAERRLEFEALRRALAATTRQETGRWAGAALRLRAQRFTRLGEASRAYERGLEVKEGLAQYVEDLTTGPSAPARLSAKAFGPDDLRVRAYAAGQAWASLLDRLSPDWKAAFDDEGTALDIFLQARLVTGEATAAAFDAAETTRAEAQAKVDVEALDGRRAATRQEFLARPGWTLEVLAADGTPLWVERFDPLNVERLGPSEILHRRFLRLRNAQAEVELLGLAGLTAAAGAHPLFEGVHSLIVTGLTGEPAPLVEGDHITLATEGLKLDLRGASLERSGRRFTLRLRAAASQPR